MNFPSLSIVPSDFGHILQVPSNYFISDVQRWVATIWAGGMGVAMIPWVMYMGLKKKEWLPLYCWIGGMIASLTEWELDLMSHIWWAKNLPVRCWEAYGATTPLLVATCFPAFVGCIGYVSYKRLRRGLTLKQILLLFVVFTFVSILLEWPSCAMGNYMYYGANQPLAANNYAFWQAPCNAACWLFEGFVLWLFVPRLKGWQRSVVVPFLIVMSFTAGWNMVPWPAYMAINFSGFTEISALGRTLLAGPGVLLMCAFTILCVNAIAGKNGSMPLKNLEGYYDALPKGNTEISVSALAMR